MSKVKIDSNAFVYHMPMVLAGTMAEGRVKFMAVGWVARVNYQPPLIALALGNPHHTNSGVTHEYLFHSLHQYPR